VFNTMRPQDPLPPAEAKPGGGPSSGTNRASPEPEPVGLEAPPSSALRTGGDQVEGAAQPRLGPDTAAGVRVVPPDPQLADLIAGMVAVDSQALRDQFARFLDRVTAPDDLSVSQPVLVRLAPVSIATAAAAVAFEVLRRRRRREGGVCAAGPGGCVPWRPLLARAVYLHPPDVQ
jgi:hypothetical protein